MPMIKGIYPLLLACDFIDRLHSLENENRLASPFLCFAAQKGDRGIIFRCFICTFPKFLLLLSLIDAHLFLRPF